MSFESYMFKQISSTGKIIDVSILLDNDYLELTSTWVMTIDALFEYLDYIKSDKSLYYESIKLEDKLNEFGINHVEMRNNDLAVTPLYNPDIDKLIRINSSDRNFGRVVNKIYNNKTNLFALSKSESLKKNLLEFNDIIDEFSKLNEKAKESSIINNNEYNEFLEFKNDALSKLTSIYSRSDIIKIDSNHLEILISDYHSRLDSIKNKEEK